jgi:uncharacterized FlaG/YvyC family protein
MSVQPDSETNQPVTDNYTYPQFIIKEMTGQIEVNFIDKASGRIIRHIPSVDLAKIVRDYKLLYGPNIYISSED